MGLTSAVLLWLLGAAVLAAVGGAALVWPRLARQRIGQVAARFGLIAAIQLLVLATALAALNDSLRFFSSWRALLGTTPRDQVVTAAAGAARIRALGMPVVVTGSSVGTMFRPGSVWPQLTALARSGPSASEVDTPRSVLRAAMQRGVVLRVTIRGEYTGIVSAGDYVYLPPQYFRPGRARIRFPVVVAFGGYPNDPLNLMSLLRLPAIASRLRSARKIAPAVYVMLNPSVALPRDTECTNIPAGLQVATFFGRDVPLAIGRTFRVRTGAANWGAIGYSTGAYCAVKMAMLYPAQFGAAVGLSGFYFAARDQATGNLYGGSVAYRHENNLFWRLAHLPAPPVSVLIASSASGEPSLAGSLAFLRDVRAPMRGYSLILRHGGHNYSTWRRELPQSLVWLSRR